MLEAVFQSVTWAFFGLSQMSSVCSVVITWLRQSRLWFIEIRDGPGGHNDKGGEVMCSWRWPGRFGCFSSSSLWTSDTRCRPYSRSHTHSPCTWCPADDTQRQQVSRWAAGWSSHRCQGGNLSSTVAFNCEFIHLAHIFLPSFNDFDPQVKFVASSSSFNHKQKFTNLRDEIRSGKIR